MITVPDELRGGYPVIDIEVVWTRAKRHAKEPFHTKTGLPFSYEDPGNYLTLDRTNRSLSRTNFAKALDAMRCLRTVPPRSRTGRAPLTAVGSQPLGCLAAPGKQPIASSVQLLDDHPVERLLLWRSEVGLPRECVGTRPPAQCR